MLLALGGLVLTVGLVLQGFASGAVGASEQYERFGSPAAPPEVTGGGPVLNLSADRPQSVHIPDRTIALTFNDGPDPRWTPQVLDVLRRHGAHATFFVVGARVAEHPELTRRLVREGHELGSHTYTHADMAAAPSWRLSFELGLTQHALAGAAGIQARLFRLPFSSTPSRLSEQEYRVAARAGRDGYVVVLTDLDTEDEDGARNVRGIVRAATPEPVTGAIVTLHDAGEDRSDTVRALDKLLSRLTAGGYRFTTVSEAVGLPSSAVQAATTGKVTGWALVLGQRSAAFAAGLLGSLFGVVALLTAVRLLLSLVLARRHVRMVRGVDTGTRDRRSGDPPFGGSRPAGSRSGGSRSGGARSGDPWHGDRHAGIETTPVSVVVPAYNEELNLEATVRSLVDTCYRGPVEVIVVDDGSTDRTADVAARLAREFPSVRLIRRPNGGKAAALNTGIARAGHDILVLVDGDTVFHRTTIGRLVAPFADPVVGAVSGNTKVANRRGLIGRWQHLEYVIGFNLDRRMFDLLQCMPTVPGAIAAFRRQVVLTAGGLSGETLAEDTDLTMAVGRTGRRVVYEESAVAWTEVPTSLGELWWQRYRWCYGTMQSMWKHRRALFGRGAAGRYGRRCLLYLTVFQVVLPLLAPAVDIYALYGLVFLDAGTAVKTWLVFAAAQTVAAGYALRLDGERLRALWVLPLQQVLHRQLMNLVLIQALVTALLGARLGWHSARRTGTFTGAVQSPSRADSRRSFLRHDAPSGTQRGQRPDL